MKAKIEMIRKSFLGVFITSNETLTKKQNLFVENCIFIQLAKKLAAVCLEYMKDFSGVFNLLDKF